MGFQNTVHMHSSSLSSIVVSLAPPRPPSLWHRHRHLHLHLVIKTHSPTELFSQRALLVVRAHQALAPLRAVQQAFLQVPPSWTSSLIANATVFGFGFPILRTGLTFPGISAAFLLGTLTWRAFAAPAFFLVVSYFIVGTAATKVKIKQKESEGIAEKRSGKRGPSSVWGSGIAGIACAIAAISGLGGPDSFRLWQLGFVASFATKLSDTVSSEIGKAYGKTTYLVTTLSPVPRGTEGAISLEGTFAGLTASLLFSVLAHKAHQVTTRGAFMCVVASQVANLFESYAGATLQDKEGFEWMEQIGRQKPHKDGSSRNIVGRCEGSRESEDET